MSDMAVARKMKSLMHWFCGQENKLVPIGILPSDENVQTVGQCLICGVTGHLAYSIHLSSEPAHQTCR